MTANTQPDTSLRLPCIAVTRAALRAAGHTAFIQPYVMQLADGRRTDGERFA
jgi:hypothetical protein